MAERKPLQKKIRFDVFKRDMFTCQYCGSKPPAVVLEVDHIDPVKNGGSNAIDNLITACFDCNRGKSDRLLSVLPESLERRAEVLAEKEEQIKAFNKLIKSQKRREEKAIDQVELVFRETYSDREFTSTFRTSVRNFLAKLPQHIVEEAMSKACSRIKSADDATKYFCGICWNIIREGVK